MRATVATTVLAMSLAALGGCRGGGTAAPSTAVATTAPEATSIAQLLAADGRFQTFVEHLDATNAPIVDREVSFLAVLDDLAGRDWTVFAPTDAAFDSLGDGAMQSLVDGPWLTSVLHRHIAPGTYRAGDLETGPLRSDGGLVDILVSETGITYGGVSLAETDLAAANGLIHVLDGVVLPPHVRTDIGLSEG